MFKTPLSTVLWLPFQRQGTIQTEYVEQLCSFPRRDPTGEDANSPPAFSSKLWQSDTHKIIPVVVLHSLCLFGISSWAWTRREISPACAHSSPRQPVASILLHWHHPVHITNGSSHTRQNINTLQIDTSSLRGKSGPYLRFVQYTKTSMLFSRLELSITRHGDTIAEMESQSNDQHRCRILRDMPFLQNPWRWFIVREDWRYFTVLENRHRSTCKGKIK